MEILYSENGRYLKRGSLCNVNSMGDCDGVTQYVCQRSFPVTAFDLVTMVSLPDLQPLYSRTWLPVMLW